MKIFIQKLIRNVEALTTARLGQNRDLTAKISEVDLLDEQKSLVSAIMCKCGSGLDSVEKQLSINLPAHKTPSKLPRSNSR